MKVSFHETREVGGPTRVGVQGRFKCQPTRARLIAGTPENVHNPAFYTDTDTQGRANIYLTETDPTWLWAISFESALGGWGPVYVAVNAAATGNWPELPRIDPDTLEPEPDPAPLWTAAVEAVKLYATESATAMTAAQEAQRLAEVAARAKVVRTVNGTAPDVLGNVNVTGGGGGGTTDHGQLTGLADDDHPQYHNNARGDARYSPTTHNHTGTYAPMLGANDNYVTDAEKAALHAHSNKAALDLVSGANTGDQDLSGYLTTSAAPELIRDTMGTALVAGANVTITKDDPGDTITIAASGGGGGGATVPVFGGKLTGGWAISSSRKTLPITAGQMIAVPLWIESARTISSVEINVSTASTAGSVRLGVYSMGSNPYAATLLADFGTVTTASAGNKLVTGLSQPAPAGCYWLVAHADEAFTFGQSLSGVFVVGDWAVVSVSGNPLRYRLAGNVAFGPLPSTFPALITSGGDNPTISVLPIFLGASA